MNQSKFIEHEQYLGGFNDEFLVVCPRCSKCAKVTIDAAQGDVSQGWRTPRKVVCPSCSYYKVWKGDSIVIEDRSDWYFRLLLWLQTSCCGEALWAYNEYHLNFLENYVGSLSKWQRLNLNRSLESRLPTWVKEAKNREAVLRCIVKLKEKIVSRRHA